MQQFRAVVFMAKSKIVVGHACHSSNHAVIILSAVFTSEPLLTLAQHTGCDYTSVNKLNAKHLNPVLSQLVKTPYFRYFKVSLWCDCPFWPDDGMCALRDCSVCECPEDDEVARIWKQQDTQSCQGLSPFALPPCLSGGEARPRNIFWAFCSAMNLDEAEKCCS